METGITYRHKRRDRTIRIIRLNPTTNLAFVELTANGRTDKFEQPKTELDELVATGTYLRIPHT